MPAPPLAPRDSNALMLALGVGLVALILLLSQEWLAGSKEATDPLLDPGRKERRRFGSLLMLLTGLTMVIGSMMSPKSGNRPNLGYVGVWLLVLAEVAGLLVFAWRDLAATRRLGKELREALAQESLDRLKADLNRQSRDESTEPHGLNGDPR